MNITGTITNYYFHCKRQCWLFANRINLEDNSEDVRMGKVLHQLADEKRGKKKIFGENEKYDHITDEYVVELKKSDTDIESAKWQLLFYLYDLRKKGIERKGRLEFSEITKQKRKTINVILAKETEKELLNHLENIKKLIESERPPAPVNKPFCKKCAYYSYCYI